MDQVRDNKYLYGTGRLPSIQHIKVFFPSSSHHMSFSDFPLHQCSHERASMLRYTYIDCLDVRVNLRTRSIIHQFSQNLFSNIRGLTLRLLICIPDYTVSHNITHSTSCVLHERWRRTATSKTLTLRLLMSYIYGAPSKARNANVVYIWTYVWQR